MENEEVVTPAVEETVEEEVAPVEEEVAPVEAEEEVAPVEDTTPMVDFGANFDQAVNISQR